MSKMTYEQQEARYQQFGRDLIDAGLLEPGWSHPHTVFCPHCGHPCKPESLVKDQTITCSGEHHAPGGKIVSRGCGLTYDIKAWCPIHIIGWPAAKDSISVIAHWRPGVGPDHPARAKFREMLGVFLADIS